MIQLLTKVNIIDNSGGSIGECIKILDPHGRKYAKIGDTILVSIQETVKLSNSSNKGSNTLKGKGDSNKLTKGSMYKALVVRLKSHQLKNLGTFEDNAVVLLKSNTSTTKKNQGIIPLGTRIKGPISNILMLRNEGNKYQKILSLSKFHY